MSGNDFATSGQTQTDLNRTAPLRIAARNVLRAIDKGVRGELLRRRVRRFTEDARALLGEHQNPESVNAIPDRCFLETLVYALDGVLAPCERERTPVNPAEVRWCLDHWLASQGEYMRPAA